MASKSALYKKLARLKEKKRRLERRIAHLEGRLSGEKFERRWGNCSGQRNRRA